MHLEKVYKQTGVKPKELADQPDMPQELAYIWTWFLELMLGGQVSWSEIHAWCQVRRIKPNQMELGLLLELNQLYAAAQHGRRRNKTGSNSR